MSDLAAVEAQICELQARAVKLRAYVELASEYEAGGPSTPTDDAPQSGGRITRDSPFYGKSLAQAAVLAIEQAGQPLTRGEIATRLKEAGWEFVSDTPQTTITFALTQLRNRTGEVVGIADGKWDLTKWRDPSLAKSVQGLNMARERGVRLGPPPKMTPELKALADKMLDENRPLAEIANAVGVSEITIKRHKAAWKAANESTGHTTLETWIKLGS